MSSGGLRSERRRTLTERSWPGASFWRFFMAWGILGRVYYGEGSVRGWIGRERGGNGKRGAYGAFGFEGLGVGGVVGGELDGAGVEGREERFGEAEFCHVCYG